MKYLSVCSGIEAASVAWNPLGWEAVAFSEIEKFPCQVLQHHYPQVPNFGDMTKFKEWPDANVDVLVGGTPCQSFSIAGLRKGLDDPRGNLMLTYLAIAAKYRPKWILWENVPGVLSSNGGRDFGTMLGGLGECGYGFAYRILDAQYFGVPQRRRRVFVVGCLGDWRSAAAVLFERHSLQGNIAPRRETGQKVAGTITAGAFNGGAGGRPEGAAGNHFVAHTLRGQPNPSHRADSDTYLAWPADIAPTLDAHYGDKMGLENQHINAGGGCLLEVAKCLITKTRLDAETETLIPTHGGCFDVAHVFKVRGGCEDGGKGYLGSNESAFIVSTNQDQHLYHHMQVRRLTPRECERLQGFPDDYTKLSDKTADGPRYKALGNSMAVPVIRWIGGRIQAVNEIHKMQAVA